MGETDQENVGREVVKVPVGEAGVGMSGAEGYSIYVAP